ncbi:DUF962 domain-containing protein [Glaciimonas sp. Gout2]|uniref:Mpo1 family 2-hydroxy fatty acid dioxygenase n=2 Tax=Glaciimonas TaxID=1229970 RepID=UPI002AB41368|nr:MULTISPECIES: Mpo1-like protein [unclassified Glaciimonas]MDY7548092.1 DUF962 domain-containing protein [Glaciimonas sp. CA11.2]MEB0010259.1 DUF962 domain-containing protein [Glaciimonas sp. Cout2]MEB0083758.1 DUF962 domain-containing protein [Glaciimonas sp. Gout2]
MQATPRKIDALLRAYAESHRNHTNEIIHCICVPAIVFALLGLLWALHPFVATIAAIAALIYYGSLSLSFAAGMVLMVALMLLILDSIPGNWVLPLSVAVFVAAWIGQFIGHHIEGKKPSFFDDLRFLLIGPLFVLSFLYNRWHLRY